MTNSLVNILSEAEQYVNTINPKLSCKIATTASGTLSISFEAGNTIDGITLSVGDRILIKDQGDGSENGIYIVNTTGAPTRSRDMDSNESCRPNSFVFIEEGTTNSDKMFQLTTNSDIILGNTSLTFEEYGGGSGTGDIEGVIAGSGLTGGGETGTVTLNVIGGDGITANADEIEVSVDDSTLELSNTNGSGSVRIKDSGVTLSKMADLANMKVIGNVSGVSGTPSSVSILDEDDMTSNSASSLSTQQSIKAYADTKQPLDDELTALAGLTSAANKIPMFNGSGSATTIDFKDEDNMSSDSATAVASQQSVKAYVDSVAQGLHIKTSCKVATTVHGVLSAWGNISSFENGDTIDGVTLSTGDRILIKDQNDATENGIYVVKASGAPDRSSDMAVGKLASGDFTFVTEGTINGDHGFVCTSNSGSDTIGTHDLLFTQFSGAGQITAGDGLEKSGNTLSIDVKSNSGIVIDNSELSLDASQTSISSILNTDLVVGRDTDNQIIFNTDNKIIFRVNGGDNITMGDGNMGIGTSNPTEKLEVYPGTHNSAVFGKAHIGSMGFTSDWTGFSHVDANGTASYGLLQHSDGTTILNAASGKFIDFRINNNFGMKLNSQGNFEVGNIITDDKIGTAIDQEYISFSTSNEVNTFVNDTEILSVTNSGVDITGNIIATGDITAFSSDKRLKENIEFIKNPLEKIKVLSGFTYDWSIDKCIEVGFKPNDSRQIGVFAQDVQSVIPEAVKPAPFDTVDGKSKSGDNYLTVQYEKIVPLLIECIKDQQSMIEGLQGQIDEIKK